MNSSCRGRYLTRVQKIQIEDLILKASVESVQAPDGLLDDGNLLGLQLNQWEQLISFRLFDGRNNLNVHHNTTFLMPLITSLVFN